MTGYEREAAAKMCRIIGILSGEIYDLHHIGDLEIVLPSVIANLQSETEDLKRILTKARMENGVSL